MSRTLLLAFIFNGLLHGICAAASALLETDPNLCVVSVKNSELPQAAHKRMSDLIALVWTFPGIPYPFIIPGPGGGAWTINEDRELVRYPGEFPWPPYYFVEKSGQIFRYNADGIDLWTGNGLGMRRIITAQGSPFGAIRTVGFNPRIGKHLVAAENGVFYFHDMQIEAAPVIDRSRIGPIEQFRDLPAHRLMLLKDENGVVATLDDDGVLTPFYTLPPYRKSAGSILDAVEIEAPGRVLIQSNSVTISITMEVAENGTFRPGRIETAILPSPIQDRRNEELVLNNPSYSLHPRFASGAPPPPQYLIFVSQLDPAQPALRSFGLMRWQRDAFEPVPGGGADRIGRLLGRFRKLWTVRSRAAVLMHSTNGLFIYDGSKVDTVAGYDRAKFAADRFTVAEMPTAGRIFLHGVHGWFELMPEGVLREIDLPAEPTSIPVEFPPTKTPILLTKAGAFSLDESGVVRRIAGTDTELSGINNGTGLIPARNELLLVGKASLFLLIDRRLSDPHACG